MNDIISKLIDIEQAQPNQVAVRHMNDELTYKGIK